LPPVNGDNPEAFASGRKLLFNPVKCNDFVEGIMATELILKTLDKGVLWLTLNNEKQRNPLSSQMLSTLTSVLDEAYVDDAVRCIVISAKGAVFSAGHDLTEMARGPDETQEAWRPRILSILEACATMMQRIVHGPKAVIACVQGTATAAGCQLVSACDMAIASSDSRFCTPGVNLGAFCTTPLVGIGRNLSRKHALEMALTGEFFSAADAERFGLINRSVSPDDVVAETQTLAARIASRSPQSIRDGKTAFYTQIEMPLNDAFEHANQVMVEAMTSDESRQGVKAFFEKRTPEWG
jgi:enoyl-CoA hydratase/carnithine racemase